MINCWWEANSISTVPLKKLVVALFIWQNSTGRGEKSLSNPFLSVWHLFSSLVIASNPFLSLVTARISASVSYTYCIFPGRTDQIGFEKIILLFGFVLRIYVNGKIIAPSLIQPYFLLLWNVFLPLLLNFLLWELNEHVFDSLCKPSYFLFLLFFF